MGNILDFLRKDTVKIVGGFLLFGSGLLLEWLVGPTAALIVFIATVLFSGIEVFYEALLGILRRDVFDEKFLMSIGAIGALIIGKGSEACAVMLFFILGEYFEHLAVKRSRASIRSLMDICPDVASVIRNGVEQTVDAGEVEVGELIVIRSGERIPLDCEVIEGEADVDTAHLTGESLPRSVGVGSVAESGSVVLNGMLKARALRVASESSASRILALVETASENKAKEEYFITKFSRYYTPTVVLLAALIGTVPPIFGWLSLTEAVYRALVFLVFSCPCALVISVPMAFFGGIGCAASRGILYKGGNVMSSLCRAKIFAFDKTGTLTTGKLEISDIKAFGVEKDELLRLAASVEYGSRHPIADCIKSAADKYEVPTDVHELSGKGIEAVVSGEKLFVGNARLVTERGIKAIPEPGGKTHVYVGSGERLYGVISFSDGVREEAAAAVTALKELGVKKMVMLTGDVAEAAVSVADSVGITDVRSQLLPKDKYESVAALIAQGEGCAFVGDGINDAPSLALSDVGIAMGGGGADSAIESADIVIMSDNLLRIPEAIAIAKNTLSVAKENIIFALGVKSLVLILGAFGFVNMWLAVFADVGVAMLAILNAMRALVYKRVKKSSNLD